MIEKIDFTKKDTNVIDTYQRLKAQGAFDDVIAKYRDPATRYSVMILEEKVQSSYMIKLDSFRHLQDLRRIDEDDEFEYTYSLDEVRKIINFSKLVPDVSIGSPLPLMLWQQSFLAKCFGWRDKKGEKRYTKVMLSIARTNGKTYLSNIINAYSFIVEADGLFNQDLAYVANTNTQAKKGFSYIRTTFMALAEIPAFKKLFKERQIDILDDKIIERKAQNKLMRMSQEAGRFDAFHFIAVTADEVGDNKNMGKIKTNNGQITSGQVQTANHQYLQISTAYPSSNSYMYADEQMMKIAMQKDYSRDLDNYLMTVYEQDSLDETQDPDSWIKSNPILGLEEKREQMIKSLISERDNKMADGSITEFQNKNLNMWLQVAENKYLDLEDIQSSVVDTPPIDIVGRECFVGFDKAKMGDTSAIVFAFPYKENNKDMWYLYEHSWIPLAQSQNNIALKMKQDNVNYLEAEEQGFATIARNEYGYINDDEIFEWFMEFVENNQLDIKFFNYDAYSAEMFIQKLDNLTDLNLMPVRQGTKSLDKPTDFFRQLMHTKSIKFLNDEMMIHSLKNAILLFDNNGIKIDKDHANTKIDIVDSIIDIFYSAIYYASGIKVENKKEKESPFSGMSSEQINDYFTNDFSF
ncbi:terminase TerL endonuclease subunit [Periweissella fabalis]|uniref:Terminase large subunit n=1 Tax=Periweissella fabalis TaxID=1070421 RepID=A0A7X6N4L1_9LACO|nr:terminase TerL endonuclease subunit [Periweissella fabalis]MCM0598313.1 terminase large subunit [Periweissella fabalis]NKZ24945.1 terminase large subunit [Periweissella fabalis]